MTAKDIIKMLPIDEKRKIQILNSYDYMDKYEKLSIDELAWTSYYELYNAGINANVDLILANVRKGEEELGDNVYARAMQKTEQELKGESTEAIGKMDLAAARVAMEQIVGEIRAAKAEKKTTHHNGKHHTG